MIINTAATGQDMAAARTAEIEAVLLGSTRPQGCTNAGELISEPFCRSQGGLASFLDEAVPEAATAKRVR